jgi:hypothetical protein
MSTQLSARRIRSIYEFIKVIRGTLLYQEAETIRAPPFGPVRENPASRHNHFHEARYFDCARPP